MFFFILLGQRACVEIDVTRGAWRDVGCGEYRPFICKKSMGEWLSVVTGMQLLLECLLIIPENSLVYISCIETSPLIS